MQSKQKRLFLCWAPFHTRSESLAYYLDAECVFLSIDNRPAWMPNILFALMKYVIAAFRSWSVLRATRPEVVLLQNPPIFSGLVLWCYGFFHDTRYVFDTHSGAFTLSRWARFEFLHKFLARRALLSLLHNEPLTRRVEEWGAPAMTVPDPPPRLPEGNDYPLKGEFNIVMICMYSADEPVGVVIEAARALPDVHFYITGSLKRASAGLLDNLPDNVTPTDFLSKEDYSGLLRGCDAVICLTLNDNTMQCGAHEAVELARPIITSDWPVLKEYFSCGVAHTNNSAEAIIAAVRDVRIRYSYYKNEIKVLREEHREHWEKKQIELDALLRAK